MNDYLTRQPYIDLLKNVIENQSKKQNGFSFAIDGAWGCGKTWVLNELEEQLSEEENNKNLVFYYNAWKNDYYDEPLIALISVMIEKINSVISQKSLTESIIDEMTKEALKDLRLLVTSIIKEVTKIDIEQSIESKKKLIKRIKNGQKIENNIDSFVPLQRMIETVRNALEKLSTKYTLIIIIDELDRCLPEYAIKVLERLHHVCNDIKLLQILAIDKKNLSDSIAMVFGKDYTNMQNPSAWNEHFTDKYLQKFVDIIIPLPNGKPDKKLAILNGLEEKYHSFERPVESEKICLTENYLSEFISQLMNGIDRRLQEKIFKQVSLCHELTIQEQKDFDKEHLTYAILIYEIISCICFYVFNSKQICVVRQTDNNYILEFFSSAIGTLEPKKSENNIFNINVRSLFNIPVQRIANYNHQIAPYKIHDTLSYIMAFFYKPDRINSDPTQQGLWQYINEDKIFLNKYDEIMSMLIYK